MIPIMGITRRRVSSRQPAAARKGSLADALFSSTQQRVLGLLFGQPERVFTLKELITLARAGSGAVQREVARLGSSGLVTVTTESGRKRLQANADSPIFRELESIVAKTTGVAMHLRKSLERNVAVRFAVLFGSVAQLRDTARSDIDVLIVSDDLNQEDAFTLFNPAEEKLGRKINPTIYTPEEFVRRRRDGNRFLGKILSGPHTVLVGSERDVTS